MISQFYGVQCDICGAIEKAVMTGNQRDWNYDPPEGWQRSKVNREVIICKDCWTALVHALPRLSRTKQTV